MKSYISLAAITLLVSACATSNFAPPRINADLVARARADRASAEQLSGGRALFVSRCLECHTLPAVTKYTREEWPRLVAEMSARANLNGTEQRSVIAYLRAASHQ